MRAPLAWEVDRPVPPPSTATYDTDPRIDEVEATFAMVDLVVPGFRAATRSAHGSAQECVRMTALDFRSMIFPTQYRVPSYGRWLVHEADMAPAYRMHRRFVQHLHSGHPGDAVGAEVAGPPLVPRRARWPSIPTPCWCRPTATRSRPSLRSAPSWRSCAGWPATTPASPSALTSSPTTCCSGSTDRWRPATTARRPARVVDVQFADFMADPFATIGAVYDRLGLELGDEAEAACARSSPSNPASRRRRQRYTWADTGLDAGALRERARPYQERFDVPSERVT